MGNSWPPKLLVVGLDGATLDLLLPWARAGLLPTFDRFLRQGCHGRLRSAPNTDTAPAWATFATGLNPANHGLFNELGWSADRRTLQPVRGADRQGLAFWKIASDAGRRVLVINVPFTYPAEPVNGVLVTGIDAPGEGAPSFCYPADFLTMLPAGGRPYRIDSRIQAAIKENQPDKGLADACAVAEKRTDTMLYAMSQGAWNLAVIVYSIPDVMQHFFWQQMARNSGPQRLAIQEGYRFIDGQIGRLLAQAGPDSNVLILSDHGFGPICATAAHLSAWLVEQGFTRLLDPARRPWRQRLISQVYGWLRRRLGERQKEALRRRLPGLRNRVESDARFANIDWTATTAFAGPSSWEVWVNRQGREPQGVVGPAGYGQLCQAVRQALLAWHDPAGRPRVQAVHLAHEVYHGRFLALAPDLTIEWDPVAAPPADMLEGNSSQFDGDHQPEGLLLAAGPAIRAGGEIEGAALVDVAPTILRLLGLEAPGMLDGRVLERLFQTQHVEVEG
ncbi:MAG: alkaline phosphatase family protein [Chloroflexi bacterium]|nr:alkaline phosphatase family protein [Chloroflexota bacterium]MCI0576594.1 alkaline phosphatase family protein [Chloroflexota bacterium]MCI0647038.1 alkaline phosphatase family protein [Chloroflexota bacterium]MCI0730738.1 alkaline phosphatase family protein [Chloroflexota bacterium]